MNANLRHYAIVEEISGQFAVTWQGHTVAEARSVFCLSEYYMGRPLPPVYYFRPADVRTAYLEPSPRTTYCPIKGDAIYRHLVAGRHRSSDALWCYLRPLPMAEGIRGCYAFVADKGVVIEAKLGPTAAS